MGVPGVGYHVLLQSTFRGPLVYGRTVRSGPFRSSLLFFAVYVAYVACTDSPVRSSFGGGERSTEEVSKSRVKSKSKCIPAFPDPFRMRESCFSPPA